MEEIDVRPTEISRDKLVLVSLLELGDLKRKSEKLETLEGYCRDDFGMEITNCDHQGCNRFRVWPQNYALGYGDYIESCDFGIMCSDTDGNKYPNYCTEHSKQYFKLLKQNNGRCWLACEKCYAEKTKNPVSYERWFYASDNYV